MRRRWGGGVVKGRKIGFAGWTGRYGSKAGGLPYLFLLRFIVCGSRLLGEGYGRGG